MRKRRYTWAASIAVALWLTACSGGQPPAGETAGAGSTSAAAPDACTVVTAADIEQVLGVAVRVQPSGQLQSVMATSLCSFENAQDSQNILSVLVRVGPPSLDAETNLKQYTDGLKLNMGEAYAIDPVEGLSGPAVWNPDMKQLTVFRGAALVILTMFQGEGQGPLEAAKALGEKALARI